MVRAGRWFRQVARLGLENSARELEQNPLGLGCPATTAHNQRGPQNHQSALPNEIAARTAMKRPSQSQRLPTPIVEAKIRPRRRKYRALTKHIIAKPNERSPLR